MTRVRIQVPFPLEGVSRDRAQGDQLPLTTRFGTNVRSVDPVTHRVRGARRSGTRRLVQTNAGGPVQAISSLVLSRNAVSYLALDEPAVEWSRTTPAENWCHAVAVNLAGDVAAVVQPNELTVHNADGERTALVTVPVESVEQARSVAWGIEGELYVGTGTVLRPPYVGRVLRFDPQDGGGFGLTWAVDAGGSVEDLAYRAGRVYVAVNSPMRVGYGDCYTNLSGDLPVRLWRAVAPFPVGRCAVNAGGELFVASVPDTRRPPAVTAGPDPTPALPPYCGVKSQGWLPTDIGLSNPNGTKGLWSWHRADSLTQANAEPVTQWDDASGQGRHLYQSTGLAAPRMATAELCGVNAVRFDGASGLMSAVSPGGEYDTSGLNLLPGYDNGAWLIVMLVQVPPADQLMYLMEHGGDQAVALMINGLSPNADGSNPAASRGQVDGAMRVTTGGIVGAAYDGDSGVAIVSFALGGDDGGVSSLAVNGTVASTWTSNRERMLGQRGFIGHAPSRGGNPMVGSVAEIVVVAFPKTVAYEDERERIEGYLAHKHGLQAVLPSDHPYKDEAPGNASTTATTTTTTAPPSGPRPDQVAYGILSKYAAQAGTLRWRTYGSGIGLGLAVDDSGGVYTLGPAVDDDGLFEDTAFENTGGTIAQPEAGMAWPGVRVGRLADRGGSVSRLEADGAWSATLRGGADSAPSRMVKLGVDAFKALYLPMAPFAGGELVRYLPGGAIDWVMTATSSTGWGLAAVPDVLPVPGGALEVPQFVYVGTTNDPESVHKVSLVLSQVDDGDPRVRHIIAVAGGDVVRLRPGDSPDVVSVAGGAGRADANSRVVQLQPIGPYIFGIDGIRPFYYDPAGNGGDGLAAEWTASKAGRLPDQPILLGEWFGSALLVGRQEPTVLRASAVGDPFDWDHLTARPTARSAWSLATGDLSDVPEPITALIPLSDEVLLIGQVNRMHLLRGHPRSVLRETGDPTGQPGRLVEVSESFGIAFGRPWCFDELGTLYFEGSRGGVYRWLAPPSGAIEPVGDGSLLGEMSQINFAAMTTRLDWHHELQTLHRTIVPVALPEGSVPEPTQPPSSTTTTTTDGGGSSSSSSSSSSSPPATTTAPPATTTTAPPTTTTAPPGTTTTAPGGSTTTAPSGTTTAPGGGSTTSSSPGGVTTQPGQTTTIDGEGPIA